MTNTDSAEQESDLPTNIGAPARRALLGAGVQQLAQVAEWREADIQKLHGVGPKALKYLREAMAEHGLRFADTQE